MKLYFAAVHESGSGTKRRKSMGARSARMESTIMWLGQIDLDQCVVPNRTTFELPPIEMASLNGGRP
jgi:hypothetical protein